MKKNIISIIIVCLSFLTSIILYQYLPEEIPIQWSGNKPAAIVSKPLTIFIIPVVMLIYYLTFYMLTIKSTQKNKALLFLASNKVTPSCGLYAVCVAAGYLYVVGVNAVALQTAAAVTTAVWKYVAKYSSSASNNSDLEAAAAKTLKLIHQ